MWGASPAASGKYQFIRTTGEKDESVHLCVDCHHGVHARRVAPDGVAEARVLGRQRGHVPVVGQPRRHGGRGHVEPVVGVRRILEPAQQGQLELDTDVGGGPADSQGQYQPLT